MSEHGALNGRILDEDLGGTQILNTRSDVADYILWYEIPSQTLINLHLQI